jgi:hypothetical protein
MKRKKELHLILPGSWRTAHCASLGSTSCDTTRLLIALSNAIREPLAASDAVSTWHEEDAVYLTGNTHTGQN